MDVSSQETIIQNNNTLATKQSVTELNPEANCKHPYDENVLENHENIKNNNTIEPLNEIPNHEPKDEIQTTVTEEIQPLCDASKCSNLEQSEVITETETEKLSTPKRKRGRPRKKEIIFHGSPRVLRSKSGEKPKVPEPVNVPAEIAETSKEKNRRKAKQIKKDQNNEFSKIKTHLRYLLTRMNLEQNFIEAYAGEGWKGQSLEKIRPEKELERAKSVINRYKLKVRDLFQRIERSCEEGRIPESLYDSEGLIDSEDIFCAKCGQTEVRLDNDIILCDGACERGFHQFCLDPPLLKEQVPPGDEGWLCPACDCKVDCVDLLNDSQGTDLSITDGWEKVFPETLASGNNIDDISGLPSDDSEDDDYDPEGAQVEDEVDAEGSSSDESEFSSASEDLGAVANNNNEQYLGLPSDDSEDDDFNPDKADSDGEVQTKSSGSDFSSDSDDLADLDKKEEGSSGVQGVVLSENNGEVKKMDVENDDFAPITAKRRVQRLDYKKLHDETYGNVSSDSSDDEFVENEAPNKRKNNKVAKKGEINEKQKENESTPLNTTDIQKENESTTLKATEKQKENESTPLKATEIQKENESTPLIATEIQKENESTPLKTTEKKTEIEGTSNSSANKSSSYKRLGEAATQRLYDSFKENQYPDRNVRENLAKELNLTHNQVSKWFENARWSFNHPGTRNKSAKSPVGSTTSTENKEKDKTPPKSRKRKAKNDINNNNTENEITPTLKEETSLNKSARRSGRVQAKRS